MEEEILIFVPRLILAPLKTEPGKPGEALSLHLELKMIADVGLIGLPNVGKSSLLNELTSARSKVANYRFTTLEPNLGTYYELILADIPGLIEGASQGKGLGFKFLKHVEHTKVLFHLVAANSETPEEDYKVVRQELKSIIQNFWIKKNIFLLARVMRFLMKTLELVMKKMKKLNKNILSFSILDPNSLMEVKKILNNLIAEKTK